MNLKQKAKELKIEGSVEFKANVPFRDILSEFSRSKLGIHTMTDEHFGIGIVEMMSSGLFTIAHDSAGPKLDIIGGEGELTGGLATSAEQYANLMLTGLQGFESSAIRRARINGKMKAKKFGDENFIENFNHYITGIISNLKKTS